MTHTSEVGLGNIVSAIIDAKTVTYNGLVLSRPENVTDGRYAVLVNNFVHNARAGDVFELPGNVTFEKTWMRGYFQHSARHDPAMGLSHQVGA